MSWKITVFILVLAMFASACADDDESNNVIDINNGNADLGDMSGNNGSDDVGSDADLDTPPDRDADMGTDMDADMDTSCPGTPCDTDFECIEGVCKPTSSCAAADNLGVLTPGTPITASGSFITDGLDTLSTTCATEGLRERVLTFELSAAARVDFQATWGGQFDGVVELRTDCEDDQSVVVCQDNESGTQFLDAGVYHVVLEVKFGNPGTYDLELEATATTCTPGPPTCSGDNIVQCRDGLSEETFACGDTCANNKCVGDSCADAITVTIPGGTYAGDFQVHTNTLNFAGASMCSSSGVGGTPTPGYDLVFYLPSLQTNDIVTIDAETNDSNLNGIFVLSACNDIDACVDAFTTVQDVDWVVPADGDYYIVVDNRFLASLPFNYTIEIFRP